MSVAVLARWRVAAFLDWSPWEAGRRTPHGPAAVGGMTQTMETTTVAGKTYTSWAKSGGGGGTRGSGWGSGSWGVHPGSSSQGQQWPMYCTPQLPTPPPPFLTSELLYQTEPQFSVQRPLGPPLVQLMLGFIAGFQQGYDAAHKAGCKQSRAASPAWWEDVVRGREGGGDKKKQTERGELGPSHSGSTNTKNTL